MSSGLTIEQVLARSLRMPNRRLKAGLFCAPPVDGSVVDNRKSMEVAVKTLFSKKAPPEVPPAGTVPTYLSNEVPATSPFFVDRPDIYCNRPVLRQRKHDFLRTSNDLLTHLVSAKKMADWQDALESFSHAISNGLSTHHGHYNLLLSTLLECSKDGLAAELVVRQEPLCTDPATALFFVEQICKRNEWQKALEMIDAA